MSWVDHVARMENRRTACTILVGITCLKTLRVSSKRRWENIIQMYFQDVECGDMDWIEWSFGFYNLRIVLWPSEDIIFSRRTLLRGFR